MVHHIAWSFGLALLASLAATFAVRAAAQRMGVVASPRPDRWSKRPTALLGGVAIYGAFVGGWLLFGMREVAGDALLVVCASAMFALGLVDDLVQLKPYAKLIVQISAATAFTTFGASLPWTGNALLNQGVTIFWIVGITNAVNLLDNMDGLAAGVAVIASAFVTLLFVTSGQAPLAIMSAALGGAALGFLVFNFNPASIFMGDCGSQFLGFCLATLSLLSAVDRSRNVLAVLGTPLMLLLLPILDTALVTVMRKAYRRPVSMGGRDHTSHRLVALGLSERGAVLLLWLLAAIGGAMAFGAHRLPTPVAVALLPGILLLLLVGVVFVAGVQVYRRVDGPAEAPGRALVPTLAEFAYKRRVFEVLFDLAALLLAYYGAFLLHYEGELPPAAYHDFLRTVPIVVTASELTFLATGLYRGLWGYATLEDTARILRTVVFASLVSSLLCRWWLGPLEFSRVVHVVAALLLLFAITSSRVSFRLIRDWVVGRGHGGRQTLVYGAGDGGEILVRELRSNPGFALEPVGFIDDDPHKVGKKVLGLPVLGTSQDLARVLDDGGAQVLVISTRKIDAARQKAVEAACAAAGVEHRTLRVTLGPPPSAAAQQAPR